MAIRTPEFLQTKSYTALRDRLVMAHGGAIQAGVWDSGDFKVTQRGAGANMSVDLAAGYCLVPANHPSNAGLYHVQNDAAANATITAAHATLPRIDQICVQVTDTTDGGGASDAGAVVVLAGTPTSGATLANRSGAASLPNGTLRLADVLVGAAVTSITNSNIRDRRAFARGNGFSKRETGGTINATGTWDLTGTVYIEVGNGTTFLRGWLAGHAIGQSAPSYPLFVSIYMDGTEMVSCGRLISSQGQHVYHVGEFYIPVTAGRHGFKIGVSGVGANGNTVHAESNDAFIWGIEEIVGRVAVDQTTP